MMTSEETVEDIYEVRTKAPGPAGELPLPPEMLLHRPSEDVFALSQNAKLMAVKKEARKMSKLPTMHAVGG